MHIQHLGSSNDVQTIVVARIMDKSIENATIVAQNDLQRLCVLPRINCNCKLFAENHFVVLADLVV